MPLANTPALLLRNAMRASVGSSAVRSITALRERVWGDMSQQIKQSEMHVYYK
jgi:hypothetical protein